VKIYAGVGSRETPAPVLNGMENLGYRLAKAGWTLRSGAAPGADSAFERGAVRGKGEAEIFLPWNGFQGRQDGIVPATWETAMAMAKEFHPNWPACTPGARKLHARNCFQVLGLTLDDPVDCVICWTKDGRGGGGTGQALRIAGSRGIPIYDLGANGVTLYTIVEVLGL